MFALQTPSSAALFLNQPTKEDDYKMYTVLNLHSVSGLVLTAMASFGSEFVGWEQEEKPGAPTMEIASGRALLYPLARGQSESP